MTEEYNREKHYVYISELQFCNGTESILECYKRVKDPRKKKALELEMYYRICKNMHL